MNREEIEALCQAIYGGEASKQDHDEALSRAQELLNFDNAPLMVNILDESEDVHTMLFACQALKRIFRDCWNSFHSDHLISIHETLVKVLLKWQDVEIIVVRQVAAVYAFLVKNAFIDMPEIANTVLLACGTSRDDISRREQDLKLNLPGSGSPGNPGRQGPAVRNAGYRPSIYRAPDPPTMCSLTLLHAVVVEMGILNPYRTVSAHRQSLTAFRDECLLYVLEAAIASLKYVADCGPENSDERYTEVAGQLLAEVTSYDFMCSFPDELKEEPVSSSTPATWLPVLKDSNTTGVLWDLYRLLPSPHNRTIMDTLTSLLLTRRSVFHTDSERISWLERFMDGTLDVMTNHYGLDEHDTLAQFCRLMNRIKPNFSLVDFIGRPNYPDWINATTDFTVQVFGAMGDGPLPSLSMLSMWARFTGSSAYAASISRKPSERSVSPMFDQLVPRVIESFVDNSMALVLQHAASGDSGFLPEDLDQETFELQLEHFASVARFDISNFTKMVKELADPAIQSLGDAVHQQGRGDDVLELQLAWFMYASGMVVKQFGSCEVTDHTADAMIIICSLDVVALVNDRVNLGEGNSNAGPTSATFALELATLSFLKNFAKIFIGESTKDAIMVIQEVQKQLGTGGTAVKDSDLQVRLLEQVVTKIIFNLRRWGFNEEIVGRSVKLLEQLQGPYTSARMMADLECVKFLTSTRGMREFPFQDSQQFQRHRMTFRKVCTSLIVLDQVSDRSFREMMAGVDETLTNLRGGLESEGASCMQDPEARSLVMGALSDLRGVLVAAVSVRTYRLVFDFLMPAHFETITMLAEMVDDDEQMETRILRFAIEFAYDRSKRIVFDGHTPDGYRLFRSVGRLVQAVVKRKFEQLPVEVGALGMVEDNEANYEKYFKGIYLCMSLCHKPLSAAYVNFSVFRMYNDPVLDAVLRAAVDLITVVPFDVMLQHRKIATEAFALIHQLFQFHMWFVVQQKPQEIVHMLHCIEGSMLGARVDHNVLTAASYAAYHLIGFLRPFSDNPVLGVTPSDEDQVMYNQLQGALDCDPMYFTRVFNAVFKNVIFEDTTNQYIYSQPLLPLIITFKQEFDKIAGDTLDMIEERERRKRLEFGTTNTVQHAGRTAEERMRGAFDALLLAVNFERELDRKRKEVFQNQLAVFRQDARSCM